MGRRPQGWRLRWKRGWAYVVFTHAKSEHAIALGTRDRGEATAAAAREYAAVVSGRRRAVGKRRGVLLDLTELLATWLGSLEGELDADTIGTCEIYARKYAAFFVDFDAITSAGVGDYVRVRLRQVMRSTMLKERVFLRRFLRWCVLEGALSHVPEFPELPQKAPGRRVGPQRAKAVEITPAEAARIVAALPVESKRIGKRTWPVRARFAFAWETGLRPETLSLLSTPRHWVPGASTLEIDDADDKARFGRTLDLTPEAVALLRSVAPPGGGLLFGDHNFSKALKRAAIAVLGPIRGKRFAAYDFRHGRAQEIADETGDLPALAYMLGHKRLSTTDKYLRPSRRRAREALERMAAARKREAS